MRKIGYACINTELQSQGITTNRTCRKNTFEEKGLDYVSELALQNIKAIYPILKWNLDNNMMIFRMSSSLFPWMSEYELYQLKDWEEISSELKRCGDFINTYDMRCGFHPGAFTIIASDKDKLVNSSIKELDQHSFILDEMGLEISHKHKVNVHIGGHWGNKESALNRFIINFDKLSPSTQKRLTIENDDKASLYTSFDLYKVYESCEVPIVFDVHHYNCHTGEKQLEESMLLALSTWKSAIPVIHFSSAKKEFEDCDVKQVAHADYLYDPIPLWDSENNFDIMVEAKAKEQAVLEWRKEYL